VVTNVKENASKFAAKSSVTKMWKRSCRVAIFTPSDVIEIQKKLSVQENAPKLRIVVTPVQVFAFNNAK